MYGGGRDSYVIFGGLVVLIGGGGVDSVNCRFNHTVPALG